MTERCKKNPCCTDYFNCVVPPQFLPNESYEDYVKRTKSTFILYRLSSNSPTGRMGIALMDLTYFGIKKTDNWQEAVKAEAREVLSDYMIEVLGEYSTPKELVEAFEQGNYGAYRLNMAGTI